MSKRKVLKCMANSVPVWLIINSVPYNFMMDSSITDAKEPFDRGSLQFTEKNIFFENYTKGDLLDTVPYNHCSTHTHMNAYTHIPSVGVAV